jgi:hypothetical protein
MRTSPAVLVLPLLALLAPPSFADATSTAWKKAVKVRMKELKVSIKLAMKPVKDELLVSAVAYGKDNLSATGAVEQAVAAMTAARDAIEDAAFDAASELRDDGHQLIVQSSAAPGGDFHAGGIGVWDKAQRDIDLRLDKADRKLRKLWAGFADDLEEAAGLHAAALDLRTQLPPHGTGFRAVPPPSAVPSVGSLPEGPLEAPEILVIARLVDTDTPDTLVLGIRSAAESVDLSVASTDADQASTGSLLPDESGTAVGSFVLGGLAHPQGFLVAGLDDGTLSSGATAVSAPTLQPVDANSSAALEAFGKDLKLENKKLTAANKAAVKDFKSSLKTQLAGVKAGTITPEDALTAGFTSLGTAQESMGLAWQGFTAGTSAKAGTALGLAGVDDAGLPGDFQPDSPGVFATSQAKTMQMLDKQQTLLGTAFTGFTSDVSTQANAAGSPFSASVIVGQGAGFSSPMVSSASTPALLPSTSAGLSTGLAFQGGGATDINVMMGVQGDPAALPSMSLSSTTLPGGVVGDLGSVSLNPGGTQTQSFTMPADAGVSGWTFNGGATSTNQTSPMVLSAPAVASPTP